MAESSVFFEISNRIIGKGHPCFIIAEIGQNHQGDLETAKKMILQAKECGVDCVKFQRSHLPAKFTKAALGRPYSSLNSFGATYGEHKMFLEFSQSDFRELKRFSEEEVGIIFGVSAMDEVALEELLDMGVAFVKIGSGDANNFPLIRKARDARRPLIISTGMQNDGVIERIYSTMQGRAFGLLHCVSSYPTEVQDVNLQHIKGFQEKFPKAVIGYSGHELNGLVSVVAVAMGASILERHFTLDKNLQGSDHKCSLEPPEMTRLVKNVRKVEEYLNKQNQGATLNTFEELASLLDHLEVLPEEDREPLKSALIGENERKLLKCEEECYRKLGKSLVYARNITSGEELTENDLTIKVSHPKGIPPEDFEQILGRKLTKPVEADTPIQESDFL
ncbi:sialic acid synthase [Lutzomyia longipalpis]|uniref:sialic acid synthase n=1 Tax=Lutzomyia longipalpis TaxID=7200 RepID=UPI00248411F9|nr:sialic acid synthase [Lutzomyia longipalpis]